MQSEQDTIGVIRFSEFELDVASFELRRNGKPQHVEPLVFDLILQLAQSAGRVLTRDEIIDKVWDGRIVSDATVSGCVKAARKALGDTGQEQRFIRTIRGRGFQFVAETQSEASKSVGQSRTAVHADNRPSIIVLPFRSNDTGHGHPVIGRALAHDIIQALSRLRWIRVIARGTAFRFFGDEDGLDGMLSSLHVRYCLTGSVDVDGNTVRLTYELVDLSDHSDVWVDHISGPIDDIHALQNALVSQIAICIETHIPLHEARRAQSISPENLDAWSAFHLGLVQMYRFTEPSSWSAIELFERAIALEPTFARAHAGLSFAHHQLAFNQYPTVDKAASIKAAIAGAERSMELDAYDPFCNFTHGRTFWLTGEMETSIAWLRRSTEISPSFAQGHYGTAFAAAMTQQPEEASGSAGKAMSLSPLDPFLWAIKCVQAFASIANGDYETARQLTNRAAVEPGALVVVDLTAVVANHLAGDTATASKWAERARKRMPNANISYFFQALRFQDPTMRKRMMEPLQHYGF